ncbi:hypothetical protein KC323_g70 [Hortaea werneckii]|nr:hypothetical protein KC323_g70 [Hortaea werneckii]
MAVPISLSSQESTHGINKIANLSCAAFSGTSSCTKCPASGITCNWNFPCICPIMRSLSNRSVPARISNFAPLPLRNFSDMPLNQSSHQGAVALRSVRQVYFPKGVWMRSEGTEASALRLSRTVRERRCHWIASSTEPNILGRLER